VDDDDATVDHYAHILRSEGFRPVTALTAEQGLDALARESIDAVLLDLRMPDIDGLEFLRRLQRHGISRAPVAMLTRDYLLDDRIIAQIHAFGVELHFKPVWVEDVVAIVGDLLARSTTRAAF
jgi:DNA-binding response OmpR family regulator